MDLLLYYFFNSCADNDANICPGFIPEPESIVLHANKKKRRLRRESRINEVPPHVTMCTRSIPNSSSSHKIVYLYLHNSMQINNRGASFLVYFRPFKSKPEHKVTGHAIVRQLLLRKCILAFGNARRWRRIK